ncbi:hypothetical protein FALBO_1448 [Fusarium albosuccineum]|uniref:Uncharacterized protein n=1 Tax=Fusarium albosuccineum TaxID=1237068 RepID=A0A8H4LPW7_9HYPO|nr:hypothetical protein FALBO_1448 [Fusarium albosuccineum]
MTSSWYHVSGTSVQGNEHTCSPQGSDSPDSKMQSADEGNHDAIASPGGDAAARHHHESRLWGWLCDNDRPWEGFVMPGDDPDTRPQITQQDKKEDNVEKDPEGPIPGSHKAR